MNSYNHLLNAKPLVHLIRMTPEAIELGVSSGRLALIDITHRPRRYSDRVTSLPRFHIIRQPQSIVSNLSTMSIA